MAPNYYLEPRPVYRYACQVVRVIDGDTIVFRIDLGFHVWVQATVRVLGWSCPELREPHGLEAKAMATDILGAAEAIIVETEKDAQTFARWLGRVWTDGEELGAKLAAKGLASRSLTSGMP